MRNLTWIVFLLACSRVAVPILTFAAPYTGRHRYRMAAFGLLIGLMLATAEVGAVQIVEFPVPSNIISFTFGPDGSFWMLKYYPSTIMRMEAQPPYTVTSFPMPYEWSQLMEIKLGPDGNFWATGNQRIARILSVPPYTITEFPITWWAGTGLTAGPDGNMWFPAPNGGIARILVDAPNTVTVFPAAQTNDLVSGPDGNIWFLSTNAVGRLDPQPPNTITMFPAPSGVVINGRLRLGQDGNLWFYASKSGVLQVGRFLLSDLSTFTFVDLPPEIADTDMAALLSTSDGNIWVTGAGDADGVVIQAMWRIPENGLNTVSRIALPIATNLISGSGNIRAGTDNDIWYLGSMLFRIILPCDDGNLVDGDGCDHSGEVETCWTCTGSPSLCSPVADNTSCMTAYCTVDATCQAGICSGTPRDCSDTDPCTVDTCDAAGGACKHEEQFVCGDGVRCGAERCDDGNTSSGDGCEADCTFTPVVVTQAVSPGDTVSTDNGSGASEAFPTQTDLTTPTGGTVSISQRPTTEPPVSGFGVLGQEIVIEAPPATPAQPLRIVFTTDASVLPPGMLISDLQISKNGVLVPDCTGPANQASPDPCISSRELLADGDARVVALTSTASTWATVAPAHDAVVLPLKPMKLKIPNGATSFVKDLKVRVLNADMRPTKEVQGHTTRLDVSSDCPAGVTVGPADFRPDTAGADDSVVLAGGESADALVQLRIDTDGISNIATMNKRAPARCTLTFTASVTSPSGNVDPVPSNNLVSVDVDFFDENDAPQPAVYESVVSSIKPVKVKVAPGATSGTGKVSIRVANANIIPVPQHPGDVFTVSVADGTCPAGTVGAADFDTKTPGSQGDVQLDGGMTAGSTLPLTINPAAFQSGGAKSPARCIASVTIRSPGGDAETRNNKASVVIDVIDKNDF